MNTALRDLGINRSYKQSIETGKYEKISFEGHQAWDLLETGPDGRMGIERVLEAMWPGAAEDTDVGKSAYGTKFVPRTIEVWRQWSVVVKLMSERFSDKLKKDVVDGEDGFARFGKECREFIFRFQAMSTVDYSKAYYLHTLLHHAGDLMRALQKVGLTLGMMSNSAAERRHEYGRRASRKALASNGWRNKSKKYATMPNLLVYITVKEMLMWEYGSDLVSHEIARRCAEEDWPGEPALLDGRRVNWTIAPRRTLLSANETLSTTPSQAGSGEDSDLRSQGLSEEQLPLLSEDEVRKEFEAGPNAPPPSFETGNQNIWGERDMKKAFAMIGLQCKGEKEPVTFNPDHEAILFDGLPVYVTDDEESVAGSEEDLHLTLDSFDFPEQDEDEDASFVILEGAEERELEAELLEWEMPKKKGGETGPDAHAGSESQAAQAAPQRTFYARQKKPTPQAAAAPVATGSPRPLVQPTGFDFVPVGSTSGVVRAQPSQPSDFTFMGSMSDGAMAPGPQYANSFGGARRPAPQAAKGRSVRGQRGRGRGGRERGGRGSATQAFS
jgi:hypothetical protein